MTSPDIQASVASNGQWAVAYARRDWPIFPVWWTENGMCACQIHGGDYWLERGCEENNYGKHMIVDFQHGMMSWTKDATTDPELVAALWDRYPFASIGFEPGSVGFAAVDVDPRHGGDVSLDEWERYNSLGDDGSPLWLPPTVTSGTGGGGYHYVYEGTCQSMNNWLPGIDIKSIGGYIVLPPSLHRSGRRYAWANDDAYPVPLDPRILADIDRVVVATGVTGITRTARTGDGTGQRLTRTTDAILRDGFPEAGVGDPDGFGRDEGLFRFACRLRRQLGPDSILGVTRMVTDAARACQPPFPDSQVDAKVRSAFSYPVEADPDIRDIWPNYLETHVAPAEEPGTEPAASEPATEARSSWAPMDLTDFVDPNRPQVVPLYLERADHAMAFYPGKINEVHGESESLKTWAVLFTVLQALNTGLTVAYVDFENGPDEIVGRLLALGAATSDILGSFRYREPHVPANPTETTDDARLVVEDVRGLVGGENASITVIDGLNEALGLHNLSPNTATEVLKLKNGLLLPMANAGSAVIVIDHTSKVGNTAFANGSMAKKNLITGVQFLAEIEDPFGRGMRGTSSLTVTKDRSGWVRGDCDPDKLWGTLVLESDRDTGRVTAYVEPPAATLADKASVIVAKAEKVLRWLKDNPGGGTRATIRTELRMKNQDVVNALAQLAAQGLIMNTKTDVRPYWVAV